MSASRAYKQAVIDLRPESRETDRPALGSTDGMTPGPAGPAPKTDAACPSYPGVNRRSGATVPVKMSAPVDALRRHSQCSRFSGTDRFLGARPFSWDRTVHAAPKRWCHHLPRLYIVRSSIYVPGVNRRNNTGTRWTRPKNRSKVDGGSSKQRNNSVNRREGFVFFAQRLMCGLSCKTTFSNELWTSIWPLYSIRPNFRNLFMK
jgi:hypothetical protein